MPVQPPQWTDFLSCPLCCKAFNGTHILPVSLGCGHTICKLCIGKLLQRKCPFDQFQIVNENGEMPVNAALLFLLGEPCDLHEALAGYVLGQDEENYIVAMQCILELAAYLKPLVTVNNFTTLTPSSLNNSSNGSLSRPMQRKLVTLISCQLLDDEGRAKCLRAARSLGERTVTELILQYQNQQQLSANLWAAVRGRGCQFLGPAMQEEVLRLILLALEDGSSLSRKVLVLFVVQKLEGVFSQASKTSIGHVVQLLYRASCFTVFKRDDESSLMQLKEEFRTYEQLRREHDSQIVQIATEAGLRIAPDQWSSLLYGDSIHKSHMQSIIDKLQTPESFSQSIKELMYALQRSNDTSNNANLQKHLEQLATIDMSPDAPLPTWSSLADALHSARVVLEGLFGLISDYTPRKSEPPAVHNAKYKTSICRDNVRGSCPRGANCTFAHGDEELERFRTRSKKFTNQRVPIDHVTTGKQESVPVSIATQKRMPHYNAAIYKASATTGHSVSPSSSTANLNNSSNTGVNSDYSEEKLQATQHIANVTPRMMTYELPAKNFLPGVAMYRSPRERQSEVQAAGYHFHHAPPSRGEYSRHKEQGMYQRPTPDTALRGLHQRRGELLERLQKAGPGYNATLDGYVEETTASEMNDQERYNHWASGYGETSIRAVMTPVIPRMMSEPTYTTSKVRNTSAGRHRSEFPDQFIPFDPPIVSKFGPIARGKDSAKFRLAEPVQAFSSQAEPMTPVTAITPTTRPFPSPSPVPSMYTCIQGQANDIVMDPYTGEPIPGNKIAHVVPVAQLQPNGQANLISPRQNQGQRVTSIAEREQLKLELGQVNQKIDKLNEYSQLTHELQMVEKSIFETEQRHQPQPSDAYAKYPNLCVLSEGHRYPTVCDIGPDYQYTETVNVAPNPGMYTHMPASVPPSALSSFVYREGNI